MNLSGFGLFFLNEGKQDIIGLNYPAVIANLFQERFGNLAFLMARWFRDYKYPNAEKPENWWLQTTSSLRTTPSLWDLTYLYDATKDEESYRAALEKLELSGDEFVDLEEQRTALKEQISRTLFSDWFFTTNPFIKSILSGELKDISPYKRLSFEAAEDKYDKQRVFKDREPLRIYPNGYKWINTGQRCQLVGGMMKNCGSAGLMSLDEDRTMLTLFDNRNKAHVVVTYSPNEKRISGDEGIGGSAVKEKYHDYILDLVKFLGVRFDAQKTKSDHLKVKYLLYDFAQKLEKLPSGGIFDNYFKFSVNNQEYYTNGYLVVSDADIKRAEALMNRGEIKLKNDQGDIIKNVFNHLNRSILSSHGMVYTSIEEFSRNKGNS